MKNRKYRGIYIRTDQYKALVDRALDSNLPNINLTHVVQDVLDIMLPMEAEPNPTQKMLYFAVIGGELRVFSSEEEVKKHGKQS